MDSKSIPNKKIPFYRNAYFWLGTIIVMVIVTLSILVACFHTKGCKGTCTRFVHTEHCSTKQGTYCLVTNLTGAQMHPDNEKHAFEYHVGVDKTHGVVDYGAYPGLLKATEDGKLTIKMGDINPSNNNIQSIRMHSTETFQSGLFVLDLDKMPAAAGVWPAWWMTAHLDKHPETWACGGEIDIIEIVNSDPDFPWSQGNTYNASTLHTNKIDGEKDTECVQEESVGCEHNNCSAGGTATTGECGCDGKQVCPYLGCSSKFSSKNSGGYEFNKYGGGVYAMLLTPGNEITVWFWSRGDADINIHTTEDFCNPERLITKDGNTKKFTACPGHFKNLRLVLNTTLCGDWAGEQYGEDDGASSDARKKACEDYVRETTTVAKMKDTVSWVINSLRIFQPMQ